MQFYFEVYAIHTDNLCLSLCVCMSLSFYLGMRLCLPIRVSLSVCVCMCVYFYLYLFPVSTRVSVRLSTGLYVSVCLSVPESLSSKLCLHAYLCLSICVSVCLSSDLRVCLSKTPQFTVDGKWMRTVGFLLRWWNRCRLEWGLEDSSVHPSGRGRWPTCWHSAKRLTHQHQTMCQHKRLAYHTSTHIPLSKYHISTYITLPNHS